MSDLTISMFPHFWPLPSSSHGTPRPNAETWYSWGTCNVHKVYRAIFYKFLPIPWVPRHPRWERLPNAVYYSHVCRPSHWHDCVDVVAFLMSHCKAYHCFILSSAVIEIAYILSNKGSIYNMRIVCILTDGWFVFVDYDRPTLTHFLSYVIQCSDCSLKLVNIVKMLLQ